jgi:hypothetical protein
MRYHRSMMRALVVLALAACSLLAASCKERSVSDDEEAPGTAEVESPGVDPAEPPAPDDAEVAEAPEVTEEGALLYASDGGGQPAAWRVGGVEVLLSAEEVERTAEAISVRATATVEGEASEVLACSDLEPTAGGTVTAFRRGKDVVFVACHARGGPGGEGSSRGARLVWNSDSGSVEPGGSFENDGPPAFDTMDFEEYE